MTTSIPLSDLLARWKPGSYDWTWQQEYANLIDHPVTQRIRERVDVEGFGFIDDHSPILLGSDSRVWDGHHRIVIAMERGVEYLNVNIV